MSEAFAFREINGDDIAELAALVADAFDGYRGFAPAGWQPPTASEQVDVLQGWIADPDFWGELALDGQALAGHGAVRAAAPRGPRPRREAHRRAGAGLQ
jgi:hypothetical protein